MLNHKAEWQDAFPLDHFNNRYSIKGWKENITKELVVTGKANTKTFDSGCKHCEESQFAHFLNVLSILEKNDVTAMTNLNLSNSNMDDCDARILAKLIKQGSLPNLKVLDVSGNQITTTGEGFFAKTMQDENVQDMVLLIKKLDLNARFIFGTKEEKIAIYKELLQEGAEKGIDTQAIVVDTSWLGKIKNFGNEVLIAGKGGWGFAKCQWNPEELLQAYAEDRLIAKLPTTLGKLAGNTINVHSVVSCYIGATEEAWNSNSGQQALKHELCVMGELEFCDDY